MFLDEKKKSVAEDLITVKVKKSAAKQVITSKFLLQKSVKNALR
jgi:hypothetical protein